MTRAANNAEFARRMRERRGEKRPTRFRIANESHLRAKEWAGTNADGSALFFDVHGQPMTRDDWARAMDCDRTIAYDLIDEVRGIEVSTVWLGTRDVLFETMVTGDGGATFYRNARSLREALELHEKHVEALR